MDPYGALVQAFSVWQMQSLLQKQVVKGFFCPIMEVGVLGACDPFLVFIDNQVVSLTSKQPYSFTQLFSQWTSSSLPPIELLYRIRKERPDVFQRTEVYIDGGVYRGTGMSVVLWSLALFS